MAKLFKTSQLSAYRDRRFRGSQEEFEHALRTSTTVYVGNLSFYTTEEQIHELFSKCGEIKRIVMGLDKNTMTPCGFCFVVYYTRDDAEDSVKYVSGTMLDERPIRVDFDWGFEDGRQWGRGRSGGQVRDEYRTDYDPGRGGYGKLVQRELSEMQRLGAMALLGGLPPPGGPPFPRQGMHHHMSNQGGGGGGYGQHGRRPRRIERRPQHHHRPSGEGGGGGAPGGGRKRGRDDDDDVQMEERQQKDRSGPQQQEQQQRQKQQQPTDASVSASAEKQKNPRFRERGDDSDDEGDKM